MDPVERFVKDFFEIDGVTLGERSRNVNVLVNKFTKNKFNDEDLARMNVLLQPRNILEEVFKLDVFLTLKYAKYLFAIFESEQKNLICRMIKSKWLFREAFCNVNSANLLDLFKRVSPITRCKIIIKLSSHLRNETIAEEYYVTIRNNYGLSAANKLLPACSVPFVKKVLENDRVEINDKQFLRLIKKDLQFAKFYFEKFNAKIFIKSLCYIALEDVQTFIEFVEKYNFRVKLNERRTRDLYKIKEDDIVANPTFYLRIAHNKTLINLLKDNFPQFFKNTYPKSMKDFVSARTLKLIKHLPHDERYDLFVNSFNEIYNVNIFDYTQFIDEEFLRIMPIEERVKYAKATLKQDNKWMCYLEIKDSLPAIYEIINLTSDVRTRSTYVQYLIETCKINDDEESLLNILRYYFNRHGNESGVFRTAFLVKLFRTFRCEKLNETYWIEITKLLKLFDVKGDSYDDLTFIYDTRIRHLYETNRINDDAILNYLKKTQYGRYMHVPCKRNLNYMKRFLHSLPDIIVNNFTRDDNSTLFDFAFGYVTAVKTWNKKNPAQKIDPYNYPKLIDVLLTKFHGNDNNDYLLTSIIKTLIDLNSDSCQNAIVLREFWKYASCEELAIVLNNVLKCMPLTLLENCDKFANTSYFYYNRNCYVTKLKYYAHLGLPEKFKEIYLAKLNDERKCLAINALVHLMPTHEYINLMSVYHFKDGDDKTFEASDDDGKKKFYDNRSVFIKALKYADTYTLTLPILEQFCDGDYLRMSLDTLYRVVDYTPIPKIEHFLDVLSARDVSVRKHVIFLKANTRDEETVYDMLKTLAPLEKQTTLAKFILKRAYKYFCKNPSERFLELIRVNSQFINKNDKESYKYFVECHVPYNYLARFLVIAWNRMSKSKLNSVKVKRFALLKRIDIDIIRMLPDTFCRKIIKSHLFNTDDANLYDFCCKFLLIDSNNRNLTFVCDRLTVYTRKEWGIYVENKSARDRLNSVLRRLCSSFRRYNLIDQLKSFAGVLYESIDVINGYEERLILQLNILYLTSNEDRKLRNFAESVANYLNESVANYGDMITNIFIEIFQKCYKDFLSDDDELYNFCICLLDVNESPYVCAFVLKLLPETCPLDPRIKRKRELILTKMTRYDQEWLQILYANYCKQMN